MYLIDISYKTHPSAVEPHAQTHGAWVKKHIENGDFLLAGPKKSGLGGIILARGMEKGRLVEVLNADSYVQADVAEYQVVEFASKLSASGVSGIHES
jgi:uncharacterized protein YciI